MGDEYNFQNSQEIVERPRNKLLLFFGISIGVVILVIIFVILFFIINPFSSSISETELLEGTTINLKANNSVEFKVGDENHNIKINFVGLDFVDIVIQSEPIELRLKLNELKEIDLDDDGVYDIQVRLESIENGIPEIYIKKIEEITSVEKSVIDSDEIILDIILPKESYEVDEEIDGDYYLKYQGEPFKGAVICCDSNGCFMSTGMIDDIDFNKPDKTNYLKTALTDTFYYEGTYDYSIYIYDCRDIENELDSDDCGGSVIDNFNLIEEILEKVTPLKSKSKSIVVTGENEEYEPECSNNDDCTQTCTNCDDGTYVCVFSSNPSINQKCVECVTDFGCVDGYECENNTCVVEEQGEEPEEETANYSVTDPDTILDCYSEDFLEILCSPEKALEFTTIFGERLGLCEISEGTFALGLEPFLGIFRGYQIQGEQDGNCIVKFWFLGNSVIDSSLLNKHMICEYDSSKRTAQDVNDCFEECCSGELVDAISNL